MGIKALKRCNLSGYFSSLRNYTLWLNTNLKGTFARCERVANRPGYKCILSCVKFASTVML